MSKHLAQPHRLYYMVTGLLYELDEELLGRKNFQRKTWHIYFKGHNLYRERQLGLEYGTFWLDAHE